MRLAFWRAKVDPIPVDLGDDEAERAVREAQLRWPTVRYHADEQHRLSRNNHFRQRFEAEFLAGQQRRTT